MKTVKTISKNIPHSISFGERRVRQNKRSFFRDALKFAGSVTFILALSVSFFFSTEVYGQTEDRFTIIETKLKELAAKDVPGLNDKVDLSVNGIQVQEFIRGIATTSNLNVSIDPALNAKIYNNFANVNVIDVFMFLAKKNDIDLSFIGTIISFAPFNAPKPLLPAYVSRQIKITYDKNTEFITLDLNNDSLPLVAKELTRITQKNVVYSPELSNKVLNGYILNMPFSKAMEQLSFSNDVKISSAEENVYLIEKKDKEVQAKTSQSKSSTAPVAGLTIKPEPNYHISVDAINIPIADIVANVSKEMGYDYFLFSDLKGNATLKLSNVTFDEFLGYILNASDYTYKKVIDMYMIGDRNLEGLRATKLVVLKYRTLEKIVDFIPADLKKGVDIKAFPDLNGLILSGSQPRINEIEAFIREVDKVVPVVQIEVILVDTRNTKTLATGIEAGLGTKPKTTGGTLYPGLDMTLGASTINEIISGINGLGVLNLGNVTPNFYITLKALETQGYINIKSSTQLSTLNGNEAKLGTTTTAYYLEVTNTLTGSLNPTSQVSQSYKSVNADFTLSINPMVSGDEQITLDVAVKQSNFTERISPSAPPGTISRDFKSTLRVKNNEMIVLGGLDETTINNSGSGVPFLSRIPVIKWFFSSRTRSKSKNKLTVFIKPTVLY